MPTDDPASHQLMHCVDGKKGWDHEKYGSRASVENPNWLGRLELDETGSLPLSLRDAVGIARLNSRDYQTNLENLYLSALNVSFERFRFDHQFFAGNATNHQFRGRDVGASSTLGVSNFANVQKLTATGGELVFGLANSLVWDFWGTDVDLLTSTLDFSIVQPLLRLGGRARVLERLTQSERTLLANVRQLEQFRQGFYVGIATGRNSGRGPLVAGAIGQAGLGLIAGTPGGRSGAPGAGGYLGLLQDQQEIRNQTANIAALRDSLAQLEAAFDANRISSRLQVDQARQALLNAQSSLLSQKAAYETRVDAFKIELGLPPTLEVKIEDALLQQFVLIDPALTELQDRVSEILLAIQKGRDNESDPFVESIVERIASLDDQVDERLANALADLDELETHLEEREQQLEQVEERIDEIGADVDARVYDGERLKERFAFLKERLPQIVAEIERVRGTRAGLLDWKPSDSQHQTAPTDETARDSTGTEDTSASDSVEDPGSKPASRWKALNTNATLLSDLLLELSLLNAETRLQGIKLLPLEVPVADAIGSARANRLDWMNARANLVDVWRRIEFIANELKSDLDIFVDGSLGTDPDNLVRFDKNNSRLRFGLRFDTPTTRLAERNRYRVALIDYQRARRDYMLFEDRITQSLRNTLRIINLSQINLEVRRAAVQVAIAQVDIARLKLNPPVRPGQASRTSPTAARDLVSALTDLLDAQNDFLNVWVSYEVLRVLLDFEMGTMRLDPQGVWIDPGPIEQAEAAEEANMPPQFQSLPDGPVTFTAPFEIGSSDSFPPKIEVADLPSLPELEVDGAP